MTERYGSIWSNDAVLPEQFFDTLRSREHNSPEKALLLAILEDAINCYRKHARAQGKAEKESFQEAKQWLMGEGEDWIFSFGNVCELLGLDPQFVRRGLRQAPPTRIKPAKPRRRFGPHGHVA